MFLVYSCSCLRSIQWSQALSWEWRCSWSSADRRCSNYIWVINKFIAFWGATYIRGFTVVCHKELAISQIPWCTCPISHNAPFRTEMYYKSHTVSVPNPTIHHSEQKCITNSILYLSQTPQYTIQNRNVLQIPHCICPKPHNTPFRTEMYYKSHTVSVPNPTIHHSEQKCITNSTLYLSQTPQCTIQNRNVLQIPHCICPTPHNTPFRTEMCTFLFWMVLCGI